MTFVQDYLAKQNDLDDLKIIYSMKKIILAMAASVAMFFGAAQANAQMSKPFYINAGSDCGSNRLRPVALTLCPKRCCMDRYNKDLRFI